MLDIYVYFGPVALLFMALGLVHLLKKFGLLDHFSAINYDENSLWPFLWRKFCFLAILVSSQPYQYLSS